MCIDCIDPRAPGQSRHDKCLAQETNGISSRDADHTTAHSRLLHLLRFAATSSSLASFGGRTVLEVPLARRRRQLLQPYDAGILDILRASYAGNRNEVKHENGPFWRQSGKMAYHCPRCNAGYTYKKTLKTHMKYDCGKEPRFKCPYCNKRDKCSSNIYKHIRMRHDGMPVIVHRN
ncbi:zinc finger protein 16-like [Odontomachus brunneus]|uniref:zinc finger protein 16-like n=2 Tax=Aculeata TaxID=7434 RepID=UPI0013F2B2B0|nr:zinc finger protein 16-like [Odontomachus brunneus]